MISKHKDLAIVFVRAISMLIIVIYHYSCSLVQDHITNKHLPLYGYASGRWGQSAVYTFLIISGYVLFMNYASHFSFKKYYYRIYYSIHTTPNNFLGWESYLYSFFNNRYRWIFFTKWYRILFSW